MGNSGRVLYCGPRQRLDGSCALAHHFDRAPLCLSTLSHNPAEALLEAMSDPNLSLRLKEIYEGIRSTPQRTMMQIQDTVPPNVGPGQQVQAQTANGALMAAATSGVGPGSVFMAHVANGGIGGGEESAGALERAREPTGSNVVGSPEWWMRTTADKLKVRQPDSNGETGRMAVCRSPHESGSNEKAASRPLHQLESNERGGVRRISGDGARCLTPPIW